MVGSEEDDFTGFGLHSHLLEEPAERHAGEAPARRESLNSAGAVAGALVSCGDLGGLHGAQISQRELGGLVDHARDFEAICVAIDLGTAVVLDGEELVLWREWAIDL